MKILSENIIKIYESFLSLQLGTGRNLRPVQSIETFYRITSFAFDVFDSSFIKDIMAKL